MAAARFLHVLRRDRPQRRRASRHLFVVGLITVAGLSMLSFVALHKAPLPEELILIAATEWGTPAGLPRAR